MPAKQPPREPSLLLHLPLTSDAHDLVSSARLITNHNVTFNTPGPRGQSTAARFNGSASLTLPNAPALGDSDFTIAAWVHSDPLTDRVGDIASTFDPDTLTGFNLGVITQQAVSGSQPNYRNLHFGIDSNTPGSGWIDCGQPGNARKVASLIAWNDNLYAGTFESDANGKGHVYRYDRDNRWIDCGSPDASNCVFSFAEMDGQLYCATGRYKAFGSAMTDSPNRTHGGHIYRYAGGKKWIDCGQLKGVKRTDIKYNPLAYVDPGPNATSASYLCTFNGKLYAGAIYNWGVWEYQGGKKWRELNLKHRVMGLLGHRGELHALFNGPSDFLRFDGTTWSCAAKLQDTTQTYASSMYEGKLYLATWPNAYVLREDEPGKWSNTGRLGYNMEVMGMAVYNGKLYAGVLPMADVHRLDGNHWAWCGNLDDSKVALKRVWSMAVARGQLFAGTLPAGKVFRLKQGAFASVDHSLSPGWHHIAAVRKGGRLNVYIDAKLAAQSDAFKPKTIQLKGASSLRIGAGQHAPMNGSLADFRLYKRAITSREMHALAQ